MESFLADFLGESREARGESCAFGGRNAALRALEPIRTETLDVPGREAAKLFFGATLRVAQPFKCSKLRELLARDFAAQVAVFVAPCARSSLFS